MKTMPVLPVDKIIAQSEHRLATVSGVVMDLTHRPGNVVDYSECYILDSDKIVPILDDEGKSIGMGTLTITYRKLRLEGSIDYSTPERLSLQIGEPLWFSLVGHVEIQDAARPRLQRGGAVKATGIRLSQTLHLDPRIKPVEIKE